MIPLLLLMLSVPCVHWTQGAESRAALEAAGIRRLCSEADLAAREALPAPGTIARAGLASPTRSPWLVANGWRFMRYPGRKYVYDVPAGKGSLAAAEAFAYGADAVVRINAADADAVGKMTAFLEALPAADLPGVADFAIVDDGSPVTGEVMNLLARRNLLFEVVQVPASRFRINIQLGTSAYPVEEAADPNAFAQKIRRQLTDEQRSLRVYGSEVVICRLTGAGERMRLHLINYGGREIEGLRIRLRGTYRTGAAHTLDAGRQALQDLAAAGSFTEFTLAKLVTYAVIDLTGN